MTFVECYKKYIYIGHQEIINKQSFPTAMSQCVILKFLPTTYVI